MNTIAQTLPAKIPLAGLIDSISRKQSLTTVQASQTESIRDSQVDEIKSEISLSSKTKNVSHEDMIVIEIEDPIDTRKIKYNKRAKK